MKQKRLEYVRQYQAMSVKEWRKVVLSDEKKFNLDGPDGFQKYWHAKNFPEENYTRKYRGGRSHLIWRAFSSSGKFKLQFPRNRQKAVDIMKMLNDLSLA